MKKQTQGRRARYLAQGAVIAALYAVLTLLAASMNLAYLPGQFRFSEALTILPVFTPAAIPGLTIGCLLSNIFSGYGIYDMVFGTLATFLSAYFTYKLRNVRFKGIPFLAPLPPVILNPAIVGMMIACQPLLGLNLPDFYKHLFSPATSGLFWSSAISIGVGEFLACYVLGILLYIALYKTRAVKIFK